MAKRNLRRLLSEKNQKSDFIVKLEVKMLSADLCVQIFVDSGINSKINKRNLPFHDRLVFKQIFINLSFNEFSIKEKPHTNSKKDSIKNVLVSRISCVHFCAKTQRKNVIKIRFGYDFMILRIF